MSEMTIELMVNGDNTSTTAHTLDQLLQQLEQQGLLAGYAVAINRNFVPKALYSQTQLNAGDDIEVLSPMQGG